LTLFGTNCIFMLPREIPWLFIRNDFCFLREVKLVIFKWQVVGLFIWSSQFFTWSWRLRVFSSSLALSYKRSSSINYFISNRINFINRISTIPNSNKSCCYWWIWWVNFDLWINQENKAHYYYSSVLIFLGRSKRDISCFNLCTSFINYLKIRAHYSFSFWFFYFLC
jgi:hypothetical protein